MNSLILRMIKEQIHINYYIELNTRLYISPMSRKQMILSDYSGSGNDSTVRISRLGPMTPSRKSLRTALNLEGREIQWVLTLPHPQTQQSRNRSAS